MTDANSRPVSPVNGQPLPRGKPNFQPGEEAREIGRRGGKKSAAKRKERKALRDELLYLLSETDKETGETHQMSISTALIQAAEKGNVKAFEIIRDTIGEKPVDNVNITSADYTALDEAFAAMGCDEK